MKPEINSTEFGSITIDGIEYDHDVMINLKGEVDKRKKKLSKAVYGTSHTVSIDEAEYMFDYGAERIIIGSGQYGVLKLSSEAESFFHSAECLILLKPTPEAIKLWNSAIANTIAMFHITC